MSVLTFSVLLVFVAQLCAGADHAKKVVDLMKSHSNIMSVEFIQRVTNGYKPTTAVHHDAISLSTVYSSTGYFYMTNSFNRNCGGTPALSFGYPVDTCMVADNFAFKLQVVQNNCNGAVVEYFLDQECTVSAGSASAVQNSDLTCKESRDPIVRDPITNGKVYSKLFCTNSAEPPRLSDTGAGIFEYFDNSDSCDSAERSFVTYTANVCMTLDAETAISVSCADGLVRYMIDTDGVPNCRGGTYSLDYPDTCKADSNDDEADPQDDDDITDDDTSYLPGFIRAPPSTSTTPFPTSAAVANVTSSTRATCQSSLVPTSEPTAAPTRTSYPSAAVATAVQFTGKLVLSGISKATFDTDVTLYTETLQIAIAASMLGVSPSDITDIAVTSGSTVGAHVVHLHALELILHAEADRRALSETPPAISVTYKVTTTSAYTAKQLKAQMEVSLNSGEFVDTLHATASSNGAFALETTAQVALTPTAEPSAAPSARPTAPSAVPSAKPTMTRKPSSARTAYPTASARAQVKFRIKQIIHGFTKATYDAHTAVCRTTFKQTIAGSMLGVSVDEITDLVVSDNAARLPAHHASSARTSFRALQSSSSSVTYTVAANSVYTAQQLADQLAQAVSSGDFTDNLRNNAVANEAPDELFFASSDSVEPQSESDSDDAVLSTGAIIGIAIGGAAFLVIVFVLFYYYCGAKSTSVVTPVH